MDFWVEYGPFLALAMSVGAFVVLKMGDRLVKSYQTPKNMSEWYPELERAYMAIVHRNRELLEAVAEAEELKKKLPAEYQVILDQIIMLARLVEHATFEQAVADGVVPRAWFSGPQGDRPVYVSPSPASPDPPEPDRDDEPKPDNVVALPGVAGEWIRSHVLRKLSA